MPTTELPFQGKDYPSGSVTLRQKFASPIYLNKCRVGLSFGSHAENSVLSYMMPRPDTILKRAQQGVQSDLPPDCRKTHWQVTPPESLSPGKEAEIAKCEAEEAAKSEARDPVWR